MRLFTVPNGMFIFAAISEYLYPAIYMVKGTLYSGVKALMAAEISLAANEPSGVAKPDSCERFRW